MMLTDVIRLGRTGAWSTGVLGLILSASLRVWDWEVRRVPRGSVAPGVSGGVMWSWWRLWPSTAGVSVTVSVSFCYTVPVTSKAIHCDMCNVCAVHECDKVSWFRECLAWISYVSVFAYVCVCVCVCVCVPLHVNMS